MSKYRIIEKKGKYTDKTIKDLICPGFGSFIGGISRPPVYQEHKEYIPRYIVQKYCEAYHRPEDTYKYLDWLDQEEFNNLVQARKYKRDLELEEGIVIDD